MGYKLKPKKAVSRRLKLTATGKLKHRREKNSHLRSNRKSSLKRRLGRAAVLHEGHSRNMRRFMVVEKLRPNKTAHEKVAKAASANDEARNQNDE